MMKICYIAHPIRGDFGRNIAKIKSFAKALYDIAATTENWPFVPYLSTVQILNDNRPEERLLGMMANRPFFERGFVDELWICGELSEGVRIEMAWAKQFGIPIVDRRDMFSEVTESVEESWSPDAA